MVFVMSGYPLLVGGAGQLCHDLEVETPPLTLLVLHGLADDFESVESLRNNGEVAPYGLALTAEPEVLAAVRTLLEEKLIEAWEESGDPVELVPTPRPAKDDASIRAYWFRWTADGERVWREGHEILDAYYQKHPISD